MKVQGPGRGKMLRKAGIQALSGEGSEAKHGESQQKTDQSSFQCVHAKTFQYQSLVVGSYYRGITE